MDDQSKLIAEVRALATANPVNPWAQRPQRTRDGRKLVITRGPQLVEVDGQAQGVEVWVRLYDVDGQELPIDPHRQVIAPPQIHEGVDDPQAALFSVLWDCIEVAPNADDWVAP